MKNSVRFGSSARPFGRIIPTCALVLLGLAQAAIAEDNRAPEVPTRLEVPDGNKVSFHANAVGVQIYVAVPSAADPTKLVWLFRAPAAVLYDNDENVVGIHYAGPTWESNSGSKVVGARKDGVTVDATAIPWLILNVVSAQGPGVFGATTYIQRVNTVGGLAPAAPPTVLGEEARVPYTAEYYFYREE